MIRNYLKIALRTLLRHKGYSFINIAGLTIGLTCCLLIFQYVAFEYSFDRFHENESDLYRVNMALTRGDESLGAGGTFTPQALGPAIEEEIPELYRYSRLHPDYGAAVIVNPDQPDRVFEEEEIFYVDRAFMEMFTFPLVAGSEANVLEPGTMLISESMAEKYFGAQNPIGQVLDITGLVDDMYQVTGVFRNVPPNSHLQFDFLLPVEDLLETGQYVDEPEDGWSFNNFLTYVQLHPDADGTLVSEKLTELFEARQGERLRDYGFTDARMYVQPLRDVYLNDQVVTVGHIAGSSYRTVYFFTIIGLVTLLIALVNYVNLATARALDRAREVGVRKAVGAERGQLIRQFLLESALTNGVAAVLAVGLAVLLTPIVNNLAGTELTLALWMNPLFWLAFLAIFGIATLLAGLYPAFVLSSFKPVIVLKGKGGSFGGHSWFRRGLVVFQFAAAVVLIGGTAIVYNQLQYMRTMDLGMNLEQVVTIQQPRALPDGTDQASANNTFAEELRRLPAVRQVAISGAHPGQNFNWQGASTWRAEEEQATAIQGVVTYIDTSFVSLYGLELVAGSNFDETSAPFGAESPSPVLANETAIQALGFASPQEALDHLLMIGGYYEVRVVGVMKDFNWSSAHVERERMFFGRTSGVGTISARVGMENLPQTIASIEEIYTELFPGNPFGYGFADEQFERQYQSDQRFASIFAGFAGLAIFIACLGLFGLAAFTAQQRTKEIGVRKVLGATAVQIVTLLSKDFARLVAIAFVIGAPIAYFIMSSWLEDFAYRIAIGPGTFAMAGLIALGIALLTVSYHAVRAAWADPARSLRYE